MAGGFSLYWMHSCPLMPNPRLPLGHKIASYFVMGGGIVIFALACFTDPGTVTASSLHPDPSPDPNPNPNPNPNPDPDPYSSPNPHPHPIPHPNPNPSPDPNLNPNPNPNPNPTPNPNQAVLSLGSLAVLVDAVLAAATGVVEAVKEEVALLAL